MAENGQRIGQAYIFSAPSAEESERAARRFAQRILCERGGAQACGRCAACRKAEAGIHPDLITVRRPEDDKGRPRREIVIDQIRAVNQDAWILPNEAQRKVYLIAEADKMNAAAQNAALKLLEEPPNGAVFLLCVSNPALLLPTVRSRCIERRSAEGGQEPEQESVKLAEEYLRAVAAGDRAGLVRWCFAQENLDQRETQAMVEALCLTVTDLLCARRPNPGLNTRQLTEIAALKKHIINYSKTRGTYEAYRKAGYSRKFFEAHREEITLHKAAKQAFDELGVRKIPKVKELSEEYAEILSGKKAAYADYRKVRDEAQEILIALRNVESLYDAESKEEQQQRQEEKMH